MDLVDDILERLIDLPEDAQIDVLKRATVYVNNWDEMRDLLNSRAIDLEYYEVCAKLRDL
jgi:hypothetical protein